MGLFFDVLFYYEYYNVYSSTRARDNGCSARKIRRKGRGGARGGGGLGKRKKIRKKRRVSYIMFGRRCASYIRVEKKKRDGKGAASRGHLCNRVVCTPTTSYCIYTYTFIYARTCGKCSARKDARPKGLAGGMPANRSYVSISLVTRGSSGTTSWSVRE